MTGTNNTIGKAVKDFLAEAEEIVDQLGTDLVSLSDCTDSGDCNPDLLNSVFRAAHSLKGLAGMFGFSAIQELAHTLENLLDSLRLGKVSLTQQITAVLFDSMELLGTMIRNAALGNVEDPGQPEIMARINNCVNTDHKSDAASLLSSLGLS